VLASVLGDGVNARLYQALVERGLATSVNADNYSLRDPYPLLVGATCAPGKGHAEVEAALKAALAAVAEQGITAAELKRAQQQIEVSVVRSARRPVPHASALGEAVASADWKWFLTYVDRDQGRQRRRRAARRRDLSRSRSCDVGWFVPSGERSHAASARARPLPLRRSTLRGGERPRTAHGAPCARRRARRRRCARRARPSPRRRARPTTALPFAARTVRKVLANGLVVDVVENHTVPLVAVRGLVDAGTVHAAPSQPALPRSPRRWSRAARRRDRRKRSARSSPTSAPSGATRRRRPTSASRPTAWRATCRSSSASSPTSCADRRSPPASSPRRRPSSRTTSCAPTTDTSARAQERLAQLAFAPGHPYRPPAAPRKLQSLARARRRRAARVPSRPLRRQGTILAIVGDVDAAP
jgi:zinc protease